MKCSVYKNNKLLESFDFSSVASNNESLFIGRGEDCNIRLDDQQISREYAEISFENKPTLKKIADDAMILVSGAVLTEPIELSVGDQIVIGVHQILIDEFSEQQAEQTQEIEKEEDTNFENELTKEINLEEMKTDLSNDWGEDLDLEGDKSLNQTFDIQETTTQTDQTQNFDDNDIVENKQLSAEIDEFTNEHTRLMSDFIQFVLKVKSEFCDFDEFVLEKAKIIIGRDDQMEFHLPDPQVSSQHACLMVENGKCFIEDLDSINGTYVNNEFIKGRVELNPGDSIIIGETFLTLEVYSEQLARESDSLMPVESDEIEEELDLDSEGQSLSQEGADRQKASGLQGFLADLKANPRKRTLYLAVLLLLVFLFLFDEDDDIAPAAATPSPKAKQLSDKKVDSQKSTEDEQPRFSNKQLEYMESHYLIAKSHIDEGDFAQALKEIELVQAIDPEYKQIKDLLVVAKDGLARLEEQERKRREDEEREKRRIQVDQLVKKVNEALGNERLELAESYLNQIYEIDPENSQAKSLREEIEALAKAKEEEALEKARKKAERDQMLELLAPGKNFYLQKKWYSAAIKLEEFLSKKGIDEDLLQQASQMLEESRQNLSSQIAPLLEQARSAKAGEDYKEAYESYLQILQIDQGNDEAHREIAEIKDDLNLRAQKIFREAMVAESLSLFTESIDKYREVLQIAPSDSDYYRRAREKLREFSWGE